jgi:hypothetical protein
LQKKTEGRLLEKEGEETAPQRLEVVKTQWKGLFDVNFRVYIN